ncbi:MAG: hypothetical protein Kow0096_19220 [Thiohalomonadaceae bacterium]
MNRLVLLFVLLTALVLVAALGALFIFAPQDIAGLAANSVDVRLVEPARVGTTLLAFALPMLAVTVYAARATLRGRHLTRQGV